MQSLVSRRSPMARNRVVNLLSTPQFVAHYDATVRLLVELTAARSCTEQTRRGRDNSVVKRIVVRPGRFARSTPSMDCCGFLRPAPVQSLPRRRGSGGDPGDRVSEPADRLHGGHCLTPRKTSVACVPREDRHRGIHPRRFVKCRALTAPGPRISPGRGSSSTAAGKPLGRLASEIARVLRGKHRPTLYAARGHR